MGHSVSHGFDIQIDKRKLDVLLGNRSYADFYRELVDEWNLDIQYKSFMALLNGKSRWLLVYAFAIAKKLNTNIEELFYPIKIEIDDDDNHG